MLGSDKPRQLDRPIAISLDAAVPRDHFYRHLEALLDLSFVRDWIADLYSPTGRPSIDPVVFFKLQLVMVFKGIRAERQFLALAADRLTVRLYLGCNLDESLPNQGTLPRTRQRLGIGVFRRFFEHIVDLCEDPGLVRSKELLADATPVPGYAPLDSLVPRLREVVDDRLIALSGGDEMPSETQRRDDSGPERWDVLEECRLDPHLPVRAAPTNVGSVIFLLVAWHSTPTILEALRWGLLTVLFTIALPFAFIVWGVRRQRFTDHHIRLREQRPRALAVGIASGLVGLILLVILGAPRELIALVVAMATGLVIALLITLIWKMSIHVASVAGAIVILILVFGPHSWSWHHS